jgi:hypothetical protein
MPAATLGRTANNLQWRRLADVDRAQLELVGVGMLLDGQHLGDDDPENAGATGSFSSTSRPAMVSRWHSSSFESADCTGCAARIRKIA